MVRVLYAAPPRVRLLLSLRQGAIAVLIIIIAVVVVVAASVVPLAISREPLSIPAFPMVPIMVEEAWGHRMVVVAWDKACPIPAAAAARMEEEDKVGRLVNRMEIIIIHISNHKVDLPIIRAAHHTAEDMAATVAVAVVADTADTGNISRARLVMMMDIATKPSRHKIRTTTRCSGEAMFLTTVHPSTRIIAIPCRNPLSI